MLTANEINTISESVWVFTADSPHPPSERLSDGLEDIMWLIFIREAKSI